MGRSATVADVHRLAAAMPYAEREAGSTDNPVYQVGGKTFVFFRNPRADAVDPDTGERLTDVIMLRVADEQDKQALVQDPRSPFFTTPHFEGYPAVLVRASRIGEVEVEELTEIIAEAWLSRASAARQRAWLEQHRPQ